MAALRMGLIGAGRFGRIRHTIFSRHPEVSFIGYCDPGVAGLGEVPRVPSVENVLGDERVDAVVIAAPNALSKQFVLATVDAGKHVFCEKPPGLTYAEACAMHAAQESHPELRVKFGFNHRLMSHYRALKEIVDTEEYGKPLWCRGLYGKGYDRQFHDGWRSDRNLSGGGILLDQGVHLLDLVMHLFPGVKVEHAMVDRLKQHESDLEDNVFALMRSAGGVPISIHSSIVQWKHTLRLEVGTEEAVVIAEGIKSSTRSFGSEVLVVHSRWRDNQVETHTIQRNEPDYYTIALECDEFVNAILHDKPVVNGSTAGAVELMRVVEDIYSFGGRRFA